MGLSKYQAFLRTIQLGNLTRAAEDLGYTQSGITHLLNALEEECDMKLVVRDKSGAYPTAEGIMLIPYFKEICHVYESLNEKIREIQTLATGLVRIGTFTSVSVQWLPDIIASFLEKYPDVDFELLQGSTEESEEWLRSGKVDCIFVSDAENSPFTTFKLHSDPIVAVCPENHPLAKYKKIDIEQFGEYPYIKLNDGTYTESREIARIFVRHDLEPNVRFSDMNDYAIVAMVEKGLGVTLLPEMLVWKTTRKIRVLPLKSGEKRTLGIAVKNIETMNNATKAFVEHVQKWVHARYSD